MSGGTNTESGKKPNVTATVTGSQTTSAGQAGNSADAGNETLPRTGNVVAGALSVIGLSIMGLIGLLGAAFKRKKE